MARYYSRDNLQRKTPKYKSSFINPRYFSMRLPDIYSKSHLEDYERLASGPVDIDWGRVGSRLGEYITGEIPGTIPAGIWEEAEYVGQHMYRPQMSLEEYGGEIGYDPVRMLEIGAETIGGGAPGGLPGGTTGAGMFIGAKGGKTMDLIPNTRSGKKIIDVAQKVGDSYRNAAIKIISEPITDKIHIDIITKVKSASEDFQKIIKRYSDWATIKGINAEDVSAFTKEANEGIKSWLDDITGVLEEDFDSHFGDINSYKLERDDLISEIKSDYKDELKLVNDSYRENKKNDRDEFKSDLRDAENENDKQIAQDNFKKISEDTEKEYKAEKERIQKYYRDGLNDAEGSYQDIIARENKDYRDTLRKDIEDNLHWNVSIEDMIDQIEEQIKIPKERGK